MLRRRRRSSTAPALALLGALALAGCTSPSDDASPSPTGAEETVTETTPDDTETPAGESDDAATEEPQTDDVALAAIATAEGAVPGSRAVAYDRDGRDRYIDIDVVLDGREHEVYVDITGTQVLRQEDEGAIDAEDLAEIQAATVAMGDAITAAVARQPGIVDDVELDTRRGSVRWEVEIRSGVRNPEILVDAVTGEVLS